MKKHIPGWILCLVLAMLMSTVFSTVYAADATTATPLADFTYKLTDEAYTITGYTGTSTSIVLPDVINDYPVTAIAASAYRKH